LSSSNLDLDLIHIGLDLHAVCYSNSSFFIWLAEFIYLFIFFLVKTNRVTFNSRPTDILRTHFTKKATDTKMWPAAVHIIFVFSVAFLQYVEADRPLVETKLGKVEGVWQTSAKGLKYAAFMGIPYAKPPVGDLRLEVYFKKQFIFT